MEGCDHLSHTAHVLLHVPREQNGGWLRERDCLVQESLYLHNLNPASLCGEILVAFDGGPPSSSRCSCTITLATVSEVNKE